MKEYLQIFILELLKYLNNKVINPVNPIAILKKQQLVNESYLSSFKKTKPEEINIPDKKRNNKYIQKDYLIIIKYYFY